MYGHQICVKLLTFFNRNVMCFIFVLKYIFNPQKTLSGAARDKKYTDKLKSSDKYDDYKKKKAEAMKHYRAKKKNEENAFRFACLGSTDIYAAAKTIQNISSAHQIKIIDGKPVTYATPNLVIINKKTYFILIFLL